MSLVEHAKSELDRAGLLAKDSDYNGMVGEAVLELVEVFAAQGHSGFSAELTRSAFDRVISYKPLTPITSDPEEWHEVADGVWQSTRQHSLFSNNGGKTWYDIDGQDEDHS